MEMYANVDMKTNNLTNATTISGTNVLGTVVQGGQMQGPSTIVTAPSGNYTLSAADWGKLILFPNVNFKVFLPTTASLSSSTGWNVRVFNTTNNIIVVEESGGAFINGVIQIYALPPFATMNVRYIGGSNFTIEVTTAWPVFSTQAKFIDLTLAGGTFLTDQWFMGSSRFILTGANFLATSITGFTVSPLVSIDFNGVSGSALVGTSIPSGVVTDTMFIFPINQIQPCQPVAGSSLYNFVVGVAASATTYEGYVSLTGYIMPFIGTN